MKDPLSQRIFSSYEWKGFHKFRCFFCLETCQFREFRYPYIIISSSYFSCFVVERKTKKGIYAIMKDKKPDADEIIVSRIYRRKEAHLSWKFKS